MANYLYPPTQGPPADLGTTSGGWFGNEFYTSSSGISIHSVGWYRRATGTLGSATLKVRDMTTGTDVVSVAAPDDGTVGWHYADLDSPVALTASRIYLVAIVVPSGFYVSGASMVPDAPWSYEDGAFGPSWYSRDATNSTRFGVSVADAAVNGSGSPGTATTTDVIQVGQDLGPWLSNDSAKNVHQTDGLPWLTRTLLQSTYDLVSTIRDRVYPSAGPLTVLTDLYLNTIKTQLDAQEALDALVSARLTGASGGGGSAFYGPDGTQVAAGVEALLARSTNAQVGFPAAPWEMTAETDWDDAIAWDQPADLYVVTFTSTPPTIPDNGRAGVPVRYRLAWWTPLNGTFAQERRWIDFENAHLVDPAGRMPGLLLQTYTSGGGHLQAWTLNV